MKKFILSFLPIFFSAWGMVVPEVSKTTAPIDLREATFEHANISLREFLINFAVESNDIYNTRKAPVEVAREVFDISPETFTHGVVRILKYKDQILGFFTLKIDQNVTSCELGLLFVKAGFQKRGLGALLWKEVLSIARARGFKEIFFIADPDSKDFYLNKGCKITGYDENLLNPKVPVPLFKYIL